MSRNFRIILSLVLAATISGCGTLFHTRPRLEVHAPKGVTIRDMQGHTLPDYELDGERGVIPDRKRTDSVQIVYGDKSETVELLRDVNPFEFLNIVSAGTGFVVDDLTGTWFNYSPIYVAIDSVPSNGIQRISTWTSNTFGEHKGERDFHMMIVLGPAISFEVNGPGPFQKGSSLFPVTAWQAGLGFDYAKEFEAYYFARFEPTYPISNDPSPSDVEITSHDLYARYFLSRSYFLQGAIGYTSATANFIHDYADFPYYSNYSSQTPHEASFPEAGIGVGWSGDIAYVSLEYLQGLQPFDIGYNRNIRYHTVYLNFGMNLRL